MHIVFFMGQISNRTGEVDNAVYDCLKCKINYCDQYSCEKNINREAIQFCLRCEPYIYVVGLFFCQKIQIDIEQD